MIRLNSHRILLIGDKDCQMETVLAQALPAARVTSVSNYFDAIAEMSQGIFASIIASIEPIERRPEAAVRTLRMLGRDGRLLLFGDPTREPVARRMLQMGCDDYVITPTKSDELQQIFGKPLDRDATREAPVTGNGQLAEFPDIRSLPLGEVILDALVQHPQEAVGAAALALNEMLPGGITLEFTSAGQPTGQAEAGRTRLSQPLYSGTRDAGQIHLQFPQRMDEAAGRHVLGYISHQLAKVALLQERHGGLVRQAIIDELTGAHNRRWFKHFLGSILESARVKRFAVTLLLFDIDSFKKYNDKFGHKLGDEILRETAVLMRRCCREHDLVARIGGDEFAVVFWEKEGPRQPKEPGSQLTGRVQQTPRQIFDRFRRLLASADFPALGPTGQGVLSICGGFASFPWDGRNMEELIEAADRDLMFGAKMRRHNSIVLVGDHPDPTSPASPLQPSPQPDL